MEEVIELIKKAKVKYDSGSISILVNEQGEGDVYCNDINQCVFQFFSLEHLRNHLNDKDKYGICN